MRRAEFYNEKERKTSFYGGKMAKNVKKKVQCLNFVVQLNDRDIEQKVVGVLLHRKYYRCC